jgi:uncharacterized membrane protein YphA (DoxX/SURF4 family)
MTKRLLHTSNVPALIPRLVVGLVFLSEGLQKFITPQATGPGRFETIGFQHPEFLANFVGVFEVVCGTFILFGLLTRLVAIPLIIDMVVAFITTKIPVLTGKGFWAFAHEYRTDFAMTLLLIFLLIYGGGKLSMDEKLT